MKIFAYYFAICAAALFTACAGGHYKTAVCPGFYHDHLQGIAAAQGKIYWSYTTKIIRTGKDGEIEKIVDAQRHHGDCCFYGGKLYVAVNHGEFNTKNKADNYVYIYDADLNFLDKIPLPELEGGLGGITHHNGSFYAVGGIDGSEANFKICKYSKDFKLEREFFVPVGESFLGAQTICHASGRFWIGVYLKKEFVPARLVLWEMDDNFGIIKKHARPDLPNCGIDAIENADGCNLLIAKYRGKKSEKGKKIYAPYANAAVPQKIEPTK